MIDGVFRGRLLDGEKLLWSGQPRQGLMLTPRDGLVIPFSLMWGGFAIFWETAVLTTGAPLLFKLWGIPFVLAGLYLIAGRFFADAYIRKRTHYAVTDRRILIMRSAPTASFTALNIDRLSDLSITESANGRGTIYFGPQAQGFGRNGFSGATPSLDPTPKFLAIENAQNVFGQIQRALRPA